MLNFWGLTSFSWWFQHGFNPFEKHDIVKLDHFPRLSRKKQKQRVWNSLGIKFTRITRKAMTFKTKKGHEQLWTLLGDHHIWVFPKIMGVPPKSSIPIGFSIIFTIHFGGGSPYFWKHPYHTTFCVVFRRVGNLFRSPKERGHTDVPKRHGDHGAGDQVAGGWGLTDWCLFLITYHKQSRCLSILP